MPSRSADAVPTTAGRSSLLTTDTVPTRAPSSGIGGPLPSLPSDWTVRLAAAGITDRAIRESLVDLSSAGVPTADDLDALVSSGIRYEMLPIVPGESAAMYAQRRRNGAALVAAAERAAASRNALLGAIVGLYRDLLDLDEITA
ncbi:MAG TPA: hypothetical protein VIO38_07525, partial [Rariglobus sp.]